MTVLCAIPLQIPVHRIRVTAQCLAIGGPVHAAALRLADYWGESPEEIAEVLGLPIPKVEGLLHDLARGGEPIEREFVLWVDHARERVLPYSALSDVAVKPAKNGPFTLYEDPPTPTMLERMGLDAGLSWDLGLEGHVQALEIIDVLPDIRDRSLPHVLRLPDTQLVITDTDATQTTTAPTATTTPALEFAIAQHGTIDPQMTRWAREHYTEDIEKHIAEADLTTTTTPKDLAALIGQGRWRTLQPHPRELREQIADAGENADERLALAAPDLRHIPTWIEETLAQASERDVQIVLCPAQGDLAPTRAPYPFTVTPTPQSPRALTLLVDDRGAVLHTDPAACLERRGAPTRQHLHASTHEGAIAALLDRLGLKRLRPSPPRHKLTPKTIAAMLKHALTELHGELPKTVQASIQPADEKFALETIDRQRSPENPTRAARKAAAGIAWERILSTLVHHLAVEHDELQVLAERWKPPAARTDLDLILTDDTKGIAWIIDAKNTDPTNEQLHNMQAQIRLLQKTPKLTGGRAIVGVIVHRKRQLDTPHKPTEHHDILRATLQRLPDLLLAKRLPGERPRTATRSASSGWRGHELQS
jgi:hypothetical protein